jgi:hypothetical protein
MLRIADGTVNKVNKYYLQDIRIWFPELEGTMACMPCCPSCGKNDEVRHHAYPIHHPARKIISFDTHYYLMSKEYFCKRCVHLPDVQYTCMGTNAEVIKRMPPHMRRAFPCVLSHCSGLDKKVVRMMRPLSDGGYAFKRLEKML